jgi:DNA-directed RNA polymerase specialized sigma24 family protein
MARMRAKKKAQRLAAEERQTRPRGLPKLSQLDFLLLLETLSEDEREVMFDHAILGRSFSEIAESMRIDRRVVSDLYWRACAGLRGAVAAATVPDYPGRGS